VSRPWRRRGAATLGLLVAAAIGAGVVAATRGSDGVSEEPAVLPTVTSAPTSGTGSPTSATGAGSTTSTATPSLAAALAAAVPATGRFTGWTEARVAREDRCLRVVVADQPAERGQGLRGVTDLAPYDGMVFVYGEDVDTPFTMSGVPIDLDIAWFDASGAPVDGARMVACPDGTDATCPLYWSSRRFRLSLETPAGGTSAGALGGCPA
jgi:uncharacterized membrane protein (UPF0127 family)